ncbi:2-dehydro-3-deoxy-6-phosphogalactonate aldolase [Sphingomonas sp. CGMCC 1.13654]|uniref:2-dehydro-3-deoxy-6-phosphogalactonate aldolase n=1 Tax=Sphingomonas chungangi TaxID=2683589 RepID=A0A838LC29_9SPHN|nr:2-dehydro-3-deoxy-6-phosphogalactonate aldolase [Sphingomonas chungangi]MBA2936179.1 2-dehydro-3-deoxy-6-phosphogalactonate aldolase [Sphingomonas chungangi]MVW55565.1 2-dehydro-3-deoxy-6-phosphogalactonate aldolase [Sphingomonas chungangi]
MIIDDILAEGAPPVVAILRGVTPDTVVGIGEALVAAGIRLIEVPLNSPDPIEGIRRLVDAMGDRALCGAGTVLEPAMVDAVAGVGGRLLVTPNVNPAVIARGVELGMEPMPGFATPTEAFTAVAAGAKRLKLFPATGFGTGYLKAIREVLPVGIKAWAVGGTGAANIGEWLAAGCEGIGVGGALYKAGDDAGTVGARAKALVEAWRTI